MLGVGASETGRVAKAAYREGQVDSTDGQCAPEHGRPPPVPQVSAGWTWNAPRRAARPATDYYRVIETALRMISGGPFSLVAGVGFEPTTSGL